jgi:serine/threonine protein kinase
MLLASGGMANVYAARQVGAAGFQRLVVVKRVHAHLLEDRDFFDMFRDEAALASLVRHPNVVPVTDVIQSGGELFLVMDYVDGVALSTVLKAAKKAGERMPAAIALRIVADTLAGLHAAHEVVDMRGHKLELVHRDVSPHNILIGADGISRLIDFGVAKAAHRSTQTRSGALKGKYPYMSPEHAKGLLVDRRSDIFAAAAVLHEALTGQRLFQGENDLDTLRRVMEAPIPDSSTLAGNVPRSVDGVLRKALARDRDDRYQTAQDFLKGVEAAMPPAPHRDVATFVERVCEAHLVERRQALQGLLEGILAPLSVRQVRVGEEASNSHRVVPASIPTVNSVPGSEQTGSKGTQITHDAPVAQPSGSRGRIMAVAVALALSIVAVVVVSVTRRTPPPPPVTAQAPSASDVAPSASSGVPLGDPVPVDEVELTVVADHPIESVHAAGIRRVDIDGTQAKVRVLHWRGLLPIDAMLAGGKPARAAALAGGIGSVHLDPVMVEAGASAPNGQPNAQPNGRVPPRGGHGAGPPPGGELHPSPYGP